MSFVAVDWGSSSFRAWLIEHDQICEQIETDQGVKSFSTGTHAAYLQDVLSKWDKQFNFIISIGMIGSSIGLHETKFSQLPIDINGVFQSLIEVPGFSPTLFIVPGVAKAGDVMRGEESQSLASGIRNGLVVLPGTHSKWIRIEEGNIVDFRTYLTGELFEIIRNHSTLSKATDSSAKLLTSADFLKGLDSDSKNLTHDLFTIRADWLQGKSEEASKEYLSGLLIGSEIKSAKVWSATSKVTIVASEALSDIYAKSLAHFGVASEIQDNKKLIEYFVAIAKRIESQL